MNDGTRVLSPEDAEAISRVRQAEAALNEAF